MKNILLFAFIVLSTCMAAQNENTLLWEITKNENSKKSYLYGTMHVNDKISYHLNDRFFEALQNVEVVANESDPRTWHDLYDLFYANNSYNYNSFYSQFYLLSPKKNNLLELFKANSSFLQNMLSGNNASSSDYQEDTVLDMFIFQTGNKLGKTNTGLEDVITSYTPIYKLNNEEAMPEEEKRALLLKFLKDKTFNEALKDLYRDKNIQKLDSLYKLSVSKKAHDAVIVNRNIDMANAMDKIMQNKTLFAAVGAAHLAGNKGMIQLLIEKGYTVKPVFASLTDVGTNLKNKFESLLPEPVLEKNQTNDGFIQFNANAITFTDNNTISSPDYTSGANFKINRILHHNFLKEKNPITAQTIDSLFFENIPGTTLSKDFTETDFIKQYAISSKTKTGNHQQYNFYITPLEVISITLIGPKNYAALYKSNYFDVLKMKTTSDKWINYKPENGGFSVELPEYYVTHTDDDFQNISLQAFDASQNSYYFVIEKTLPDSEYLEDIEYEKQQIQTEFLLQYAVEPKFTTINNEQIGTATLKNGNTIALVTKVKGAKYYLLGCVNTSEDFKNKFFNSFAFQPFNFSEDFRDYTDTENTISMTIPYKENKVYFYNMDKNRVKEKNQFSQKTKYYQIKSKTGQKVDVYYTKYHRYEYKKNIDSMYNDYRQKALYRYTPLTRTSDYSYETYPSGCILGELSSKKGFQSSKWIETLYNFNPKEKYEYKMLAENQSYNNETGEHKFSYLVSCDECLQAIKTEVIFKNDASVSANALVDKNDFKSNTFANNVLASIQLQNQSGNSLFTNKWQTFVNDANSNNDSIRYSALNSTYYLTIEKENVTSAIKFLKEFTFKPNEANSKSNLLYKIASIESEEIMPFLDAYYRNSATSNEDKFLILRYLSSQKTKKAYDKILELLEYDLPLSANEYEVTSLFEYFEEDLENSKFLLPKIMAFYSIPEYNKPIVSFCSAVTEAYPAYANKIKSYQKMFLANAKLELKRMVSWIDTNQSYAEEEDEEYDQFEYLPDEAVLSYMNILYKDAKKNKSESFFKQIQQTEAPSLAIEMMRLASVHNRFSEEDSNRYVNNPKTAFLWMLLQNNTFAKTDEQIATLALHNFYSKKANDSISLLHTETVFKNDKKVKFFFFKIAEKEPKNYENSLASLAFIYTKNNTLNINAYNYFGEDLYDDEEKLPEIYKQIIETNTNQNRQRASFVNKNETKLPPVYDYYDDY
ncbi:TraB/GumN family protein [Flavobacterium sp.]|uniref:TraB/GumN family protein n=1 Tax=Flavobacterium sp. TaxID=239 RepID=UPI0035289839